jgi:hypothetical protein
MSMLRLRLERGLLLSICRERLALGFVVVLIMVLGVVVATLLAVLFVVLAVVLVLAVVVLVAVTLRAIHVGVGHY